MEEQDTTIVENIKKEGQKFIAIIQPIEIEDEIVSEAVIPSNIDVEVGDTVIIEKGRGRFVIKEILLDLLEEGEMGREVKRSYELTNKGRVAISKATEEEEETEPLVLEETENEPLAYYETPKESIFKKLFNGVSYGGLIAGGGILFLIFNVLHFLFTAIVGLLMIGWAISMFLEGSIIVGLLILFIATPIAIGIARHVFMLLFPLVILVLIIWGIIHLFGFNLSFGNVWDSIWLAIKILILGFMVYFGILGFIGAIREKKALGFFKKSWLGILLFCFLFWLFFLVSWTGYNGGDIEKFYGNYDNNYEEGHGYGIIDFERYSDNSPTILEDCERYGGRNIAPINYEKMEDEGKQSTHRFFLVKEISTHKIYECVFYGVVEKEFIVGDLMIINSCCFDINL